MHGRRKLGRVKRATEWLGAVFDGRRHAPHGAEGQRRRAEGQDGGWRRMKRMLGLVCWLRGWYWTWLYSSSDSIRVAFISGHNFVERDDGSLECLTCGAVSE